MGNAALSHSPPSSSPGPSLMFRTVSTLVKSLASFVPGWHAECRDGALPGHTDRFLSPSCTREDAVRPRGIPGAYERNDWTEPPIELQTRKLISPINKLPYELLALILEFVEPPPSAVQGTPSEISAGDLFASNLEAARQWIAFSHVCARWRTVVLDMAVIWARHVVSLRSPTARTALLARTRDVPLDGALRITHPRLFHDASFLFLRAHLRRMRRLALVLPERALPGFGLLLRHPPPLRALHSLRVELDAPSAGVRMQQFRRMPLLDAPALQELVFRDCFLFFRPTTTLRVLDVACAPVQYRSAVDGALLTPAELLAVLRAAPNLETLRLANAVPCMSPPILEVGQSEARIALPRLTSLEIGSTPARAAGLLAYLDVPARASVVVQADRQPRYGGYAVPDTMFADDLARVVDALRCAHTAIRADVRSPDGFTVSRAHTHTHSTERADSAGSVCVELPHWHIADVCRALARHCTVPVRELCACLATTTPVPFADTDRHEVCERMWDALEKVLVPPAREYCQAQAQAAAAAVRLGPAETGGCNLALAALRALTVVIDGSGSTIRETCKERAVAMVKARARLGTKLVIVVVDKAADQETIVCPPEGDESSRTARTFSDVAL